MIYGGNPARFICRIQDFKDKNIAKLKNVKTLVLNGKRPYELNKKNKNDYFKVLDNFGYNYIE